MGILNFFKKRGIQKTEPKLEKIKFSEINNWLDNKNNQMKKKEKEILNLTKEKIDSFFIDFNKKVKILENIDIESKKVEGRVKIIVGQGLDKYLNYLYIFRKELKDLKNKNVEKTFKDINKIFLDLHEHSNVSYNRANYLIGDELVAIKQEINNFSKYFIELFNKNDKMIKSLKTISSIELNLVQFNSIQKNLDEVNSDIKSLDDNIKDNKKKEEKILEEINKIKTSKEYIENLKKQRDIESDEKKLEESVLKLKGLINFKNLSNICHSDKKSMDIIRDYKENFKITFQKENLLGILKLMDESNINSEIIRNKIKDINERKQKIMKNKELVGDNGVMVQLEKIQKIKHEVESLNFEKTRSEKKYNNIKENKKDILKLIGKEVEDSGAIINFD